MFAHLPDDQFRIRVDVDTFEVCRDNRSAGTGGVIMMSGNLTRTYGG
jgi:hypothetical protein